MVTVPKTLREKLGDAASDDLIQLMNQARDEQKTSIIEFVEEKFERRLSEEFTKLDKRISQVESSLREQIAQNNANQIKWMFIFWAGQIAVLTGILFAFFK